MADPGDKLRDPGVERDVLSCVLQSGDAWLRISDSIGPEDFTHTANRALWGVITHLRDNDITPDVIGVYDKLPEDVKKQYVDDLGSWGYIETLATLPIDPTNVEHHATKLHDLTILRRGFHGGEKITFEATQAKSREDFLAKVDEIVNDIPGEVGSEVTLLGSIAEDYINEKASNPKEVPGISTGYKYLDQLIGGYQPGRMYIVGARTGVGKSIFQLNSVKNIAVDQRIPVLYISTEQSGRDEISRLLSIVSEVREEYLNKGTFIEMNDYAERMDEARQLIQDAPIYFAHEPMFTPERLYRLIKKYALTGPRVQAVFFDYIKIPTQNMGSSDKWAVVGDLAYGLKAIAAKLEIPIITSVQVNRDGLEQMKFTGEIDGSSFALSDMIEAASSVAMILRPLSKKEEEDYSFVGEKRMLTFSKNRHGSKSNKILFGLGDGYVKLTEKQVIVP